MAFEKTVGTRAQVWHGTCKKTSGGLTKSDLMMNKAGRIVSKAKHLTAKKEMRLVKHGYGTKKGKFGFVKIGSKKHRKGHKKMRGGSGMGELSPANSNGSYMIKDLVPQAFSPLDRALVGGRRHKKSMRMRGGMAYGSGLYPADVSASDITGNGIDGQGITNYGSAGSIGVQEAAGMSGGKRRRMRGGTTKPFPPQGMGSPLNAALNA